MNFNFSDFAATEAAAKDQNQGVKIGFFKLADKGEALVRFNVVTLNDSVKIATIHKVKRNAADKYTSMSVSCLAPSAFDKTAACKCPLCVAAEAGDDRIKKVERKIYIQMLVSYKDSTTGNWLPPAPVIWERAYGFSKELATKISSYGDLTQHLFKITRTGSALDTKYTIDYAVPTIFKPELVPNDFSAFNNFDLAKHSYWVKTAEDCEEYVKTGAFPEVVKSTPETVAAPKAAAPIETPVAPTEAEIFSAPKAEEKPTAPAPATSDLYSF